MWDPCQTQHVRKAFEMKLLYQAFPVELSITGDPANESYTLRRAPAPEHGWDPSRGASKTEHAPTMYGCPKPERGAAKLPTLFCRAATPPLPTSAAGVWEAAAAIARPKLLPPASREKVEYQVSSSMWCLNASQCPSAAYRVTCGIVLHTSRPVPSRPVLSRPLSLHSSHTTHLTPLLTHRSSQAVVWQAQCPEPSGGPAGRLGAAGPRLPFLWQAQDTEPSGGAAGRVGAQLNSTQLISLSLSLSLWCCSYTHTLSLSLSLPQSFSQSFPAYSFTSVSLSFTFIVQYFSVLFYSQSLLLVANSYKLNMWGYPVLLFLGHSTCVGARCFVHGTSQWHMDTAGLHMNAASYKGHS